MNYKTVKQDFLLNKITSKDTLFAGDYTIDPYQNCEFSCLYCDSSFDKTIYIKSNVKEILNKELSKNKKSNIIVGSVHDPYQKAEEKHMLTRDVLKVIQKHGFSCNILTKSDLVLRDLDILSKIKNCVVTISLTSFENDVVNIFEKNVTSPFNRIKVVKKLNKSGVKSGVAIMPVLPFIVDKKNLEEIIKNSKENNAVFVIHKHLELKGDQKNIYFKIIKKFYPEFLNKYEELYNESYMPQQSYINNLDKKIKVLCRKYDIVNKI